MIRTHTDEQTPRCPGGSVRDSNCYSNYSERFGTTDTARLPCLCVLFYKPTSEMIIKTINII